MASYGSQVLPAVDDFTDGATPYPVNPDLYINWGWWHGLGLSVPHPTTGVYTLHCDDAQFSNHILTDKTKPRGHSANGSTNAGLSPRALETSSDVDVFLRGVVEQLCGGSNYFPDDLVPEIWVAARLAGGTINASTNSLRGCTAGYFFGWRYKALVGATWYLLRQDGASITVLSSRVFNGGGSSIFTEVDPRNPFELRLKCETVSGNVRLRAYVANAASVGEELKDPVLIFDVTDSSVSKITAAGRVGVAVPGSISAPATPTYNGALLIESFEVKLAGTTWINDQWARAWPNARAVWPVGGQTLCSKSYSGNRVECGWGGDFTSNSGFQGRLQRSSLSGLANRVHPVPGITIATTTLSGGYFVSQRPSTSSTAHHRRVTVRFSSVGGNGANPGVNPSGYRRAGVALRIASLTLPGTQTTPTAGYVACLARDDNAAATKCELWRLDPSGPVLIAQLDPFTVSEDTDYQLALSILNAGSPAGAQVEIEVSVDGVQVDLVAAHASVTADSSGTVTDASSSRVTAGFIEAIVIHYAGAAANQKTVLADAWTELTLPVAATLEQDYPSIAVAGEDDDYSGQELTIPYDWSVREVPTRPRLETRTESGHDFVCPRHSRKRRVWSIGVQALTDAQRDALWAFWNTHKGVVRAFNWKPISHDMRRAYAESAAVKVHFATPELGAVLRDRSITSFEFELEALVS